MIRLDKTAILNKCLLFILMLPVIGVMNFRRNIVDFPNLGFISRILDYLLVIDAGIIGIYILLNLLHRKYFFCLNTVLILITYVYILVRTFLADFGTERAIISMLIIIPFLDIFIKSMDEVCCITDVLGMFNLLNFISILFWHGVGGLRYYSNITNRFWSYNYLLGYDNGFIVLILPLICLSWISYKYTGKKIYIINIIISVLTEIVILSAGSLIALLFLALLCILSKSKYISSFIHKPVINMMVLTVGSWALVVFKIFNLMDNMVMTFFGKNLSGQRALLWETGYQRFKNHPFFGYGFGNVVLAGGYNAPHQMMLDWLLQGGIIEFALFFVLLFLTFRMLSKGNSKNALIIYNGIFSFLLAYLAESYSHYTYYWIFLMLCIIANKMYKGEIHDYEK